MKLVVFFSLLVSSVSYATCPQECLQYARQEIINCLMDANNVPGTEEEKAKVFQACIERLKKTPKYIKCNDICSS